MRQNEAKGETFEVKTGGHWLVKALKVKGVDFVFGTSGAGMPDIQDAMVVEKPPKWIQGLHEFTTVCAAAGYALSSERPGFALIDRIVGTQNSAGAFYAAFLNSAPLVALATANAPGVPIETGDKEYHFARDQARFLGPWVKWATNVNSLDTLAEDLEKAIYMACAERQGPTYITVRQDLLAQTITSGHVHGREEPPNRPNVPDDETCGAIIDALMEASGPQVVAANVGRHKESVPALVEFAHLFGCGVSVKRDFMDYPRTDPLYLGTIRFPGLPKLMEGTNLVFGLELGLLPHLTLPESVSTIDLTGDPLRIQETHHGGDYGAGIFPASIRCICDDGATLRKLVRLGAARIKPEEKAAISERRSRATAVHERQVSEWRARAKKSLDSGKLDGWSVGHILNKNWSKDIVWVDGTFSFSEALSSTVEIAEPGSYFSNPSAHLGPAAGMAYGVALADRHYVDVKQVDGKYASGRISPSNKLVICTVGDGDAVCGNLDSALWTCQHYGIGVLYLILNNACWAAEWHGFESTTQHWTKEARDFECIDVDAPRIDFETVAKGYSVRSYSARTPEEFETTLIEGMRYVRRAMPALVDVRTEKFTSGPSVVP